MRPFMHRTFGRELLMVAAVFLVAAPVVRAAPVTYSGVMSGANESPPVTTMGNGIAEVTIDATAHTMRVRAQFQNLTGTTTVAHIHAPTAVAGSGNANVATTTPSFAGWPSGVQSGSYDNTLNMTLASSYNGSFITANGGTTAGAEAALFQAIADGKAYFNVHTTFAGGGEIRAFLTPGALLDASPAAASSRPTLRLAGANPGPEVRLAYSLPHASRVDLSVLDITGRLVTTLVRADRAAGNHEARWSGVNRDGSRSAPGLYFARLRADGVDISLRVLRIE